MVAMTDLDELKEIIAETWRDEEMASSACHGVDAYAKRWPYVLVVKDWDIWDESGEDLKHEVVRWLRQHGGSWDFYHLLDTWGLMGFKDAKAASHFQLRWSGMLKTAPASSPGWNPHPLNSSFAPTEADERSMRTERSRQAAR